MTVLSAGPCPGPLRQTGRQGGGGLCCLHTADQEPAEQGGKLPKVPLPGGVDRAFEPPSRTRGLVLTLIQPPACWGLLLAQRDGCRVGLLPPQGVAWPGPPGSEPLSVRTAGRWLKPQLPPGPRAQGPAHVHTQAQALEQHPARRE